MMHELLHQRVTRTNVSEFSRCNLRQKSPTLHGSPVQDIESSFQAMQDLGSMVSLFETSPIHN